MKPLYTPEEFESAKAIQKLLLECLCCHKPFLKAKRHIQVVLKGKTYKTMNYCSNSCREASNHPPIFVVCEQCQKQFRKTASAIHKTQHNFCCKSCAAKYSNAHKTTGTRCSKLEKWLQEQLTLLYPSLEFHFNRRDTLNAELDIFIPSIKLAFELNGIFHYEPIYGQEKLSSTQNNDQRKFQACLERSIELCILDTSSQKYFKVKTSQKYLDIISDIINLKLSKNSLSNS